jgi:hypothetical protein
MVACLLSCEKSYAKTHPEAAITVSTFPTIFLDILTEITLWSKPGKGNLTNNTFIDCNFELEG